MSVFWQERLAPMKSHLVAHSQSVYDFLPGSSRLYPDDLHERAMIVKKLDMIPVEFIFRSRMEGSLLKAYQKAEDPYGLSLPAGYQKMSQVGHDNIIPLFTPTDKSEDDLPLLAHDVVKKYRLAHELALAVYMLGRIYILKRGIELVDGKFEVGIDPQTGEVTLGDECLTPDCCRFVAEEDVVIGQEPRWMDKQFIRAEAERIWDGGTKYPLSFDKTVVSKTQHLYTEIAEMLMKGNV
jgi:phosphoribosylaminoimidazole-succinocarboxamide synthase